MGAFDFKRCEGYIPQLFIDSNFPVCPICGSRNPGWTLRDTVEQAAARVMFRCSVCGCILSSSTADLSGMAASSTGNADSNDFGTAYIRIESTGNAQAAKFNAGKELPIGELKGVAASPSQPAVNAQNTTSWQPQAQVPQQPYAAASQGYPQQPYTAAPLGYPQQPYTAQPHTPLNLARSSGKLNIGAIVLAIGFLCSYLAVIVIGLLNGLAEAGVIISNVLEIAAGGVLIVAVCLRSKVGNVLFTVSLFISASSLIVLLLLFSDSLNTLDTVIYAVMALALMVSGIMYLFMKKVFAIIKMVLMIAMMTASILQFSYYQFFAYSFDLSSVLLSLPYPLADVALGICVILSQPFATVKIAKTPPAFYA